MYFCYLPFSWIHSYQFNWKYAIEESTDVDCLSCHSREGRDSQTWLPISIILEKRCRKFLGPFTPYETLPPPSPLRWLCVAVLPKPTFRTTKRTMLREDACQCFHRPYLINWGPENNNENNVQSLALNKWVEWLGNNSSINKSNKGAMLPPPWSQHPTLRAKHCTGGRQRAAAQGGGYNSASDCFHTISLHHSTSILPLSFHLFLLCLLPFSLSFPSFLPFLTSSLFLLFLIIHFYHSFLCFFFLKNSSLPHISKLTLEIPCMSENIQPKGTTGQSRPSTATLMDVHDRGRAERFQIHSLLSLKTS